MRDLLFSSIFLTILQIFCPKVTLIRDQVLINVGAYDLQSQTYAFSIIENHLIADCW